MGALPGALDAEGLCGCAVGGQAAGPVTPLLAGVAGPEGCGDGQEDPPGGEGGGGDGQGDAEGEAGMVGQGGAAAGDGPGDDAESGGVEQQEGEDCEGLADDAGGGAGDLAVGEFQECGDG